VNLKRPGPFVFVIAAVLLLIAVSWTANVLDVRARAPFASVASAFDAPPGYPGYGWSRDGHGVIEGTELTTIAGPSHCGWETATMLFIGWPPGTSAVTFASSRMFIRDPKGVYAGGRYREGLALHATLPADARPTGHRLGPIALYLSPGDDGGIYVVAPSGAERWPRVDPPGLCA
jgi:hypothetical protein